MLNRIQTDNPNNICLTSADNQFKVKVQSHKNPLQRMMEKTG